MNLVGKRIAWEALRILRVDRDPADLDIHVVIVEAPLVDESGSKCGKIRTSYTVTT